MAKKYWSMLWIAAAIWAAGSGCVQRTLTVCSDPPGALVYLNDQEIGRTPLTRIFIWYGVYDVELRKTGYQSIKTTAAVIAPWWQFPPFDFFAELFPVTDHHEMSFTMRPPNERVDEPELLIKRGEQLGSELESTRKTTTQPATKPHEHGHKKPPTTKPVTKPATRE
ncbi:MAG TPA: PEGA domain-containing protein [Tepidisphaeraceae bacterium]|jgi:hypothetical protein|nr:PEGA domain-containing protein [Tepidisphaeraceae bacterium]